MPLQAAAADPHGATVMVTSSSADSQLASTYAPAVIAIFGSGNARIAVRATEPGGPAGYESALRADLAARKSAGAQLLKNSRIRFTAQDAAQLRAGAVDSGSWPRSRRWRPSTRSGWLRSSILPPASRSCSGT